MNKALLCKPLEGKSRDYFKPLRKTLLQEKFGEIVKTHLRTLDEHLPGYHSSRNDIAETEAVQNHLLFMTATFFEDME